MKTLLLLLLTLSMVTPAIAEIDGNGGGGVNENGVYKTFYSAGLYVAPEPEVNIPGAELYTQTITSLVASDQSKSKLLMSALPIGDRKFYRVLESKMGATVMNRLLNEYARVVEQPMANLAIFAITDIGEEVTYLLPSFYKLSEIEQAAILFHEAYWILKPKSSYPTVLAAESAFQKFIVYKANGKLDTSLLHILENILDDGSIALKTAFLVDVQSGKLPTLFTEDQKITLKKLFVDDQALCSKAGMDSAYVGETIFGRNKYKWDLVVECKLSKNNIQSLLLFSKKYSESLFLKELMRFVSNGRSLYAKVRFSTGIDQKKGDREADILKTINIADYLNKKVAFLDLDISDYQSVIRSENVEK